MFKLVCKNRRRKNIQTVDCWLWSEKIEFLEEIEFCWSEIEWKSVDWERIVIRIIPNWQELRFKLRETEIYDQIDIPNSETVKSDNFKLQKWISLERIQSIWNHFWADIHFKVNIS